MGGGKGGEIFELFWGGGQIFIFIKKFWGGNFNYLIRNKPRNRDIFIKNFFNL